MNDPTWAVEITWPWNQLGTTTKKETIHEALRLVAERSARLQAIQELLSIDRDWTGIVDDDKGPAAEQDAV